MAPLRALNSFNNKNALKCCHVLSMVKILERTMKVNKGSSVKYYIYKISRKKVVKILDQEMREISNLSSDNLKTKCKAIQALNEFASQHHRIGIMPVVMALPQEYSY